LFNKTSVDLGFISNSALRVHRAYGIGTHLWSNRMVFGSQIHDWYESEVVYIECVLNALVSYFLLSCVFCPKYSNKFCEQCGCSPLLCIGNVSQFIPAYLVYIATWRTTFGRKQQSSRCLS